MLFYASLEYMHQSENWALTITTNSAFIQFPLRMERKLVLRQNNTFTTAVAVNKNYFIAVYSKQL